MNIENQLIERLTKKASDAKRSRDAIAREKARKLVCRRADSKTLVFIDADKYDPDQRVQDWIRARQESDFTSRTQSIPFLCK